MTFAQKLKSSALTSVFLVESTAGLPLRSWILHSGSTYKAQAALTVTSIAWNLSTPLTPISSIALVVATSGSWFQSGGWVYLNPPTGQSVFSNSIQALVSLFFSNVPKVFNNDFYEPRLKSAPKLSLRIASTFGGVGQIGGGSLSLINTDGFFDSLKGLRWDAGKVVCRLGIDVPGDEMAYGDYRPLGAWQVEAQTLDDQVFTLRLRERKLKLEKRIPFETYERSAFPFIRKDDENKSIPLAYGRILGASAVLIDPNLKVFKLASHAIHSIEEVRVQRSRELTKTGTVSGWVPHAGGVFKVYFTQRAVELKYNGTALTEKRELADVLATSGSWGLFNNFLYIHGPGNPISATITATWTYNLSVWEPINPASQNLEQATFRMGDDFNGTEKVSVDFIGKKNGEGTPMLNAADIVQDLLAYAGETTLNGATFAASRAALALGTDQYDRAVVALKPSVYLSKPEDALKPFDRLNAEVGSFLFCDLNGQWNFVVFTPAVLSGLVEIPNEEILDFERVSDDSKAFSSLTVHYAQRLADDWSETLALERLDLQYQQGQATPRKRELAVSLCTEEDARLFAQRLLSTEGPSLVTYKIRTHWGGYLLLPGQQIRVRYARRGFDAVLEVIDASLDLTGGRVDITATNRRGWGETFGHWCAEGVSSWPTGGTDTDKLEARTSSGFWAGDDQLAVSSDPKSFQPGRWW